MRYLRKLPENWLPPHCPNPNCKFHRPLPDGFPCKRDGSFTRTSDNRRIQRFLCKHCGRSFSTQTFSITYWLKKPTLPIEAFTKFTGAMSNRQLATDLKLHPNTIDNLQARIARHCFLFHAKKMAGAKPPAAVVVDGFVSFELSQYYPFQHHIAVEKDTDFFCYFTDSETRRCGKMTEQQKKRRQQLEARNGRPDPQAVRKDMTELLQVTLSGLKSATVYSDAHKAYPKAIRAVDCDVTHLVTPGKEHRDRNNNLWEVNLTDLQIRHYGSNHKRETIAWSKRRQGSAERMGIFLVFKNYVKPRRVKQPRGPTPAMERGMLDRSLAVEELFQGRIFRDHVDLPPRWAEYYDRLVETRALGRNRRHELKYAR